LGWNFNRFLREIDFLGRLLSSRMDRIKDETEFSLLVKVLDAERAKEYIKTFFNKDCINVLGIDGSMSYEERMEIVVLYIAVSGFKAPITIADDGTITPIFSKIEREEKYTFSTVIPIWIEDLNEILGTGSIGLSRSLEAAMESIPFSLMTFGEYFMGLRGLKGDIDILLLDRPLASSIHPYRRDARRLIFEDGGGGLTNVNIDGRSLSLADLFLGVFIGPYINNEPLFKMPYRSKFKTYAIIQYVIKNGGDADLHELSKKFPDIRKGKNWERMIKKLGKLNNYLKGELLHEETIGHKIELKEGRLDYWSKIIRLIEYLGNRIFFEEVNNHPLLIGDDVWLSTRAINTLTLLTIYEIGRVERLANKLVIGIGKDTYVTDLYRSVIPVARYLGLIKKDIRLPIKSDRPLLTLASSLLPDVFKTPWRFIGYDGSFATMVKNGIVNSDVIPIKAARKIIYPEGIIVRSYFQLRSLRGIKDIEVRSPVFFYDRFQRKIDELNRRSVRALEGNSEVLVNLYLEVYDNPLDNMILYILSVMDNPEITEATGHNYLLFMADKDVKAVINSVKEMIINVADIRINRVIRERGIFVVTRRFRDFRRLAERRRK